MTFSELACLVAHHAGRPRALAGSAVAIVVAYFVWGIEGTNLAISIVSLILLFVLQASQNAGDAATHAKIDELLRAGEARDEYIGIDKLPEDEVQKLREEGK